MILSILTLCYNEGEKIRENLIKIKTFFDNIIADSWELIFFNDGSTDDTIKNISDLSETDSMIKIISYKINRSRGYALRQGNPQSNATIFFG